MKRGLLVINVWLISAACLAQGRNASGDSAPNVTSSIDSLFVMETSQALAEKFGAAYADRIERGVRQTAKLWIESDGKQADFRQFCLDNFVMSEKVLDSLAVYLSEKFTYINGSIGKIGRYLGFPNSVDTGPITPLETIVSRFSANADVNRGYFDSKIAFVVLLNYPHFTNDEILEKGAGWSAREWAHVRMGGMFANRPAAPARSGDAGKETDKETDRDVKESKAEAAPAPRPQNAGRYVNAFTIPLTSLTDRAGRPLFTEDVQLLFHWKMRDEIRKLYTSNDKSAFEGQKSIFAAMNRIIDQSVPKQVVGSAGYVWNPYTNELKKDGSKEAPVPTEDERYGYLKALFMRTYEREKDGRKFMDARFKDAYGITAQEVEHIFVTLISSPQMKKVVALAKKRLGRNLQPFDIWYEGFSPRSFFNAEELDAKTYKLYPTPQAFQDSIPGILMKLGYTKESAQFFGDRIAVDPARAMGHAQGAGMRDDKARLRTNFRAQGLDYGGLNTGMHELGHTVQQTISTYLIDIYPMRGLPNSAVSEAAAYIMQFRTMKGLMEVSNPEEMDSYNFLDKIWSAYEMSGMALCEMMTYKWMFEKQGEFTAAELKNAMLGFSKEIWNKYYAPNFGGKDEIIFAVYNHQLTSTFYLAGYALGHQVHIQLEQHFLGRDFPSEFERVFKLGRLTPGVFMHRAVGSDLSVEATLKLADYVLGRLNVK